MTTKHLGLTIAACLLLSVPAFGKGPKVASGDSSIGGYSGKGVGQSSTASKYSKAASRFPTQPSIKSKYSSAATRINSAAVTSGATGKQSKYSMRRPASAGIPASTTFGGKEYGDSGGQLRFPKRPAASSPAPSSFPSRSTPTKAKPQTAPYRRPPVVFYPKTESVAPRTKPSPPQGQPTSSWPTSSTSPKKSYYSGLRPRDPSPTIGVNRPTVINNQTTNITNNIRNTTNNVTNINNIRNTSNNVRHWYQDNRWQNQLAINSRHWNERPWWYTPDYGDWHHGHWYGQNYFRGRDSWNHVDSSENQWLSGLVSWGLGSLVYRTGYQSYSNPYYVGPVSIGTTTIDYSHPICVQQSPYEKAYADNPTRAQQLRSQSLAYFDRARKAFFLGDSSRAYNDVSRAIALMPDDTSLHEFRALVLFSEGRFHEAAEAIHAVLAVAPGWDWTTLSGLYSDHGAYERQLRELEKFVSANPRQADVRFLLAYHYITMGHPDSAADSLQAALILNPEDRLSADLLNLLQQDSAQEVQVGPADDGVVRRVNLQGDWKAVRPEGEIKLQLDNESFMWDYDLVGKSQILRGRYKLSDDLLIMATPEGSQMVGKVSMPDKSHLTFRLLGTSDHDPGVEFVRR